VILLVEEFLNKIEGSGAVIIDSRSENEFLQGHIPGAFNIPLLNNEHRQLVGTTYKQKGKAAAVEQGFELVGPLFAEIIRKTKEIAGSKNIFLYCWRGGMRSGIMSWLLTTAGMNVDLLKGGYKTFRRTVLNEFEKKKNILILSGHTGSGKTSVLKALEKQGEQIIDLEAFANHRGSAFGSLGMPPQPTNEQFENFLGMEWRKLHDEKIVWIEAESRSIGRIKIPDAIYLQLQNAPLIEMLVSESRRKKNILDEYGKFSKDELSACTEKLQKRLGGLRVKNAMEALDQGDLNQWLSILFEYYDKTYTFTVNERKAGARLSVEMKDNESFEHFAEKLRVAAKNTTNNISV
jgi:tRNA 2-selenouridine synthase